MTSKELLQSQVEHGDFTGTSGIKLTAYLDCRPLVVDLKAGRILAQDMIELIRGTLGTPVYEQVGSIGGALFAGAILAQHISFYNVVPFIPWFAFDNKKEKLILPLEKPKKCIVIDDVITTGGTLKKMLLHIKASYIEVQGIYVLVDRRVDPTDQFETYPIYSLFKKEILDEVDIM
jgi:orotate phosphoribosyltransferase